MNELDRKIKELKELVKLIDELSKNFTVHRTSRKSNEIN